MTDSGDNSGESVGTRDRIGRPTWRSESWDREAGGERETGRQIITQKQRYCEVREGREL